MKKRHTKKRRSLKYVDEKVKKGGYWFNYLDFGNIDVWQKPVKRGRGGYYL